MILTAESKTLEAIEKHLADLDRRLTRNPHLSHDRRELLLRRIEVVTRDRDRLLLREYKRLEARLWDIAETLGEGVPFLHVQRPRL
jgi:hypothetical protein